MSNVTLLSSCDDGLLSQTAEKPIWVSKGVCVSFDGGLGIVTGLLEVRSGTTIGFALDLHYCQNHIINIFYFRT